MAKPMSGHQFGAFNVMKHMLSAIRIGDRYQPVVLKSEKPPHRARVVANRTAVHEVNLAVSDHEIIHQEMQVRSQVDPENHFWAQCSKDLRAIQKRLHIVLPRSKTGHQPQAGSVHEQFARQGKNIKRAMNTTDMTQTRAAVHPFTRRSFMKTTAFTVGAVAFLSQGKALAEGGSGSSGSSVSPVYQWALRCSKDPSQAVRAAYGARLVSENGRAAAFQTALSLPPDRQPDALYGVLNRGATQEEGAKWLLESLALVPPGVPLDRSNLTLGVAQQMLERSGSSVMAWALAIPDPPLRDATAAGVMNSWLVMDSMEASAWLGKQPAGSIKDAAICEVAKFLAAHGDLAAARGWLAEMHNSAKKGALEKDIQVLAEGAPR